MTDLIESIKANPIGYYVGLVVGVFLLILVISLIVKNQRKKKQYEAEKQAEMARIEKHVNLEAMIAQMEEQQNNMKDIDPVANFEQEQEEQAIISYQELVNAVKSENKENTNDTISVTNVSSTGEVTGETKIPRNEISEDKSIFLDEIKLSKKDLVFDDEEEVNTTQINKENIIPVVEETTPEVNNSFDLDTIMEKHEIKTNFELKEEEIKELEEIASPEKKETSKFKNTEFISPIYGRQNSNITYPKIASFTKAESNEDEIINISNDLDPNVEFLKTLREYRNND